VSETLRTGLFAAAAVALVATAVLVRPDGSGSEIFSDQGEALFPSYRDAEAVKAIEVIDYDEAEATARPLKVEFRRGRWVLSSHSDYPAEARDRLARTAAALVDLKRDIAVSDRWEDQAQYGVIDPLDPKNPSLTGRGKRVSLRDGAGAVLAELVLGLPMKEKPGYRYVRLPRQKRIFAVQTDADPSASFEDWAEADLLRIQPADIARMTLASYSIDEQFGRLMNMRRAVMVKDGENWNAGARAAAAALGSLRVVGARAKPKLLAEQLRSRRLEMSLDTVMSLRQRGFFIAPTGQLLANEGELIVETAQGVVYHLRFGEVAAEEAAAAAQLVRRGGENRFLFVTVSSRNPEQEPRARALDARFADWYYIIRGRDFERLRPGVPSAAASAPAQPASASPGARIPTGASSPPPPPGPPATGPSAPPGAPRR
jgi:hypothetical protein